MFFSTEAPAARWGPAREPTHGSYRIILEFYLETEGRVDAKHDELDVLGY